MTSVFVWTTADIVYLFTVLVTCAITALFCAPHWYKRLRCKHDAGVWENHSCDAICKRCGKNLGFIDNWRNL